jgi:hypothetical protein
MVHVIELASQFEALELSAPRTTDATSSRNALYQEQRVCPATEPGAALFLEQTLSFAMLPMKNKFAC